MLSEGGCELEGVLSVLLCSLSSSGTTGIRSIFLKKSEKRERERERESVDYFSARKLGFYTTECYSKVEDKRWRVCVGGDCNVRTEERGVDGKGRASVNMIKVNGSRQ